MLLETCLTKAHFREPWLWGLAKKLCVANEQETEALASNYGPVFVRAFLWELFALFTRKDDFREKVLAFRFRRIADGFLRDATDPVTEIRNVLFLGANECELSQDARSLLAFLTHCPLQQGALCFRSVDLCLPGKGLRDIDAHERIWNTQFLKLSLREMQKVDADWHSVGTLFSHLPASNQRLFVNLLRLR